MSRHILTKTFQNFPHGGVRLTIMLALAEAANEQGNCIMTQQALADSCRMNRVSIWRNVHSLVDERWVVIDAKQGRNGSTIYQLNLPMIFRARRPGVQCRFRAAPEIPVKALLEQLGLAQIAPPEEEEETHAA